MPPVRSTGILPVSRRGILPLFWAENHGQDARGTHGQDGQATKLRLSAGHNDSMDFPRIARPELRMVSPD
jgi:hypothetical protein